MSATHKKPKWKLLRKTKARKCNTMKAINMPMHHAKLASASAMRKCVTTTKNAKKEVREAKLNEDTPIKINEKDRRHEKTKLETKLESSTPKYQTRHERENNTPKIATRSSQTTQMTTT